jgi:FkbH-like protein
MGQKSSSPLTIAVAANFLANEIRDSLTVWFETLVLDANIVFCPHDSIIQQLLDQSSMLATADFAVILLGVEKWCFRDNAISSQVATENFETFFQSIRTAIGYSFTLPLLIISCPLFAATQLDETIIAVENELAQRLNSLPNVEHISCAELLEYYPTAIYDDYFTHNAYALEDYPYSKLCFATLGTMVARRIYTRFQVRCKVIVVDCDNTLWSGVCAEQGPLGITIDHGNRALQELLLRQQEYGRLLCLCSKNQELDVMAVFDQHPNMILKLEHITAHRINWLSKAENLLSLSKDLGLSLDTFLFLDDDAFECASVTALCSDVKTIQMPENNTAFRAFLMHVWELDKPVITIEDQRRSLYYRQNAERDRAQGSTSSLDDFIESLDLKVRIELLDAKEVPRAVQLMQRVNQFNLNGVRLSSTELMNYKTTGSCYTVHACDRFGDYGFVGLVICGKCRESLKVHSLLLSCRALGRGVEQRLQFFLEDKGNKEGCVKIEFDYLSTQRNVPMLNFLQDFEATQTSFEISSMVQNGI